MALTSGERAALWRKRQREDTGKHAQYKAKERERYQKRKQTGEIKPIGQLSDREQRKRRKNWRQNQRSKREKDKIIMKGIQSQLSPPASPEGAFEPRNNKMINASLKSYEKNRSTGRKKKNLNRSRVYREQFRLRIELDKERRLKNKYKSKYYRILNGRNSKTETEVSNEVQRIMKQKVQTKTHLTHYCFLLRGLKTRYKDSGTSERQMIKKILFRQAVLRKYKLGMYTRQKTGITEMRVRQNVSKYRTKQTELKTSIVSFFERDDNSRMKGGKKATITRRKIKKQVRLLNDSIKNLHQKYLFETEKKISYSLFARMKPFYVIRATEKDRETCLCKVHENPALKVNKLFSENVLSSKSLNQILTDITCDINSKECMYRSCSKCKTNTINTAPESDYLSYGKIVEWKVWKSRRVEREKKSVGGDMVKTKHTITVKDTETGTITTLIQDLQTDIERLARHEFNISHQYKQLKNLKENCKASELILHIDFSENYLCKYKDEIQSVHFGSSKNQISIHTVMAYTHKKSHSFATLSDNLSHGPCAIWAHLQPVIVQMKQLHPELTKLHMISDGPTTQYRCKSNFYMFSTSLFDHGFDEGGTWNFMEAGHGKGAPDGIGAVIKRTADSLVNTQSKDITRSADLIDGIRELGSTITLFEISGDDVSEKERILPADIRAIPETMKLHQVVVKQKGIVSSRVLSCFCSSEVCGCFSPVTTSFGISSTQLDDRSCQNPSCSQRNTEIEVLQKLTCVDESLVGKWVVVNYDDLPYPGIVVSVDDGDLEVKAMSRIGRNRFYWPLLEDQYFYTQEKIVTVLEKEPEPVTSRHVQLPPKIWELIESEMNL